MSWFRRSKIQTNQYLIERRIKRPQGIFGSILVILVVALILLGLFFGGRWLYQNLDGKTTPKPGIVTDIDVGNDTSGQATSTPGSPATAPSQGQTSPSTVTITPTTIPNTGPEPE